MEKIPDAMGQTISKVVDNHDNIFEVPKWGKCYPDNSQQRNSFLFALFGVWIFFHIVHYRNAMGIRILRYNDCVMQ